MRKFLHTTLAAAALFAVGNSANAAISSMDELVGWQVKMLLRGTPANDYAPYGVFSGEIIKKDDGKYYLTNFLGTGTDCPLEMDANKNVFLVSRTSTNNGLISVDGNSIRSAQITTDEESGTTTFSNYNGGLARLMNGTDLKQQSTTDYYGSQSTGTTSPMIIKLKSGETILACGWHITAYKPNTEVVTIDDGTTTEAYLHSDKTIYNYGGLSLTSYTYESAGNGTMNSGIKFGINTTGLTATLTARTAGANVSQIVSGLTCTKEENPTVEQYYVSDAENLGDNAVGKLTPQECEWKGGAAHWIAALNDHIYAKDNIVWCEMPELAVYNTETFEVKERIPASKFLYKNNTSINFTPAASIKIDNFGFDSTFGMYAEATLTPTKLGNLVESWELYVVPTSTRATAKELSASYSATSPTDGAILLDSTFDTDPIEDTDAQSDNESIKFTKLVPPSVIGKEKANYYTFFAKMNVKGLAEPVYGFVNNYDSNDITTGVDNIEADGDCGISGGNGVITIGEAAGNNVTIYNISGQKIYENAQGTVNVAPGVYVVKTENATVKVAVK